MERPDLTHDVLLNPFSMVSTAGINGMFLPWLTVGGLLLQGWQLGQFSPVEIVMHL